MKIYKVIFNQYTNCMYDTISNGKEIRDNKIQYIKVGNQPFLITEDQIDEISRYGKGIKEMIFVGNLWDKDKPYAIERV